jgi:hypothetical protein
MGQEHFPLQPGSVSYRYLILEFSMTLLPCTLFHLVYKISIVLITLYTLLIVSNSVIGVSAHILLTERLNFQIANCIKKFRIIVI